MGNSYSDTNGEVMVPVPYSMMDTASDPMFHLDLSNNTRHAANKQDHLTGYEAVWSFAYGKGISPVARIGSFTVIDKESQIAYMGYGSTKSKQLLNDLWALNLTTYEWKQIRLIGYKAVPRGGSKAVLYGNKIIIFGGFADGLYVDDLHTIDIETGLVEPLSTTGPTPCARTTPIMTVYNDRLIVWGGYCNAWPNGIHELDLNTLQWNEYPSDEKGRTSCPSCIVGNKLMIYGSSAAAGWLSLDLDKMTFSLISVTGDAPPNTVLSSGMVHIDNWIFFFGGKTNKEYMDFYVYNIPRKHWFRLPIIPDEVTTLFADGFIDTNGEFKLPNNYSFNYAYSKVHRTIMYFFGQDMSNPPRINHINVGKSISVLNHSEDMLAALNSK